MPLKPDAAKLVARVAKNMGPSNLPTVEIMRRSIDVGPLGAPPAPVGRVEDRIIPGGDRQDLTIRIHWPTDHTDPLPLAVYLHGGGWVAGGVQSHDVTARMLATVGSCIVISVDYRLAPEHRFPDGLNDCMAVTDWVAAHGAEIGGDPGRLALVGDSAGANLVVGVTLLARRRHGPPIALQVLVCPSTDFTLGRWPSQDENATGFLLTTESLRWCYSQYADPSLWDDPLISPILEPDLAGLPPALIITAEFDPLRDEGMAYAQRLLDAGVRVSATCFEGQIHGFFRMDGIIADAAKAHTVIGAALRQALAPRDKVSD